MGDIEFFAGGGGAVSAPTPHPSLYLPDGWNTGWLAQLQQAQCHVMAVADSHWTGTAPNTDFALSVGELLIPALRAKYGKLRIADYWPAYLSPSLATLGVTPWSALVGPMAGDATAGWHGSVRNTANASGAGNMVFTSPYPTNHITIYYVDATPGTFTYRVDPDDAGVDTTVTMAAAAQSQANTEIKRIDRSGLSFGVKTVTFGNGSLGTAIGAGGGGSLWILGIAAATGATSGIGYARMMNSGFTIGNWSGVTPSTQYPVDRIGLFSNKSPQRDSTNRGVGTFTGFPLTNLGLCIFQIGINDFTGTGTNMAVANPIEDFMGVVRMNNPNCSFLLVVPMVSGIEPTDSPSHTGWAGANSAGPAGPGSVEGKMIIARNYGLAVANFQQKWWPKPIAAGFRVAGNTHPTDAGHVDMFNALLSVL